MEVSAKIGELMAKGDDSWRELAAQHMGEEEDISLEDIFDSDDTLVARISESVDKELRKTGIEL